MYIIGLMSGTSADGIDAALCDISGEPGTHTATIISGLTHPYDADTRAQILAACDPTSGRVDHIARLNTALAEQFAAAVEAVISAADVPRDSVALIGSHGQTVWHHVDEAGRVTATLQIGEAAVIAERTGITTVSNFRPRDVAAGGQGAPLTGYVDWLLLRHPTQWRAVQNIGGMGNVTFLPPRSDTTTQPIAFDTGPGNALLDAAVLHFTGGAQTYDRDGLLAKQGQLNEDWLAEMLEHPYYQRDFPKTTGRELFGTAAALRLIAAGESRGLSSHDIIATLTALTATNIAQAYERFAPAPIREVILGGGGSHNPVMMGLLDAMLPTATLRTHEDVGLSTDYKEALVFALLAYETWHGRVGTLPSLTGATHATVLGQITPGENYGRLTTM